MNNFSFYSPTEFVFGRDAESNIGKLAKEQGATNALIVYGGGSAVRSGLIGKLKKLLDESGIANFELSGVHPNPTDDKVYEGIEIARKKGIDFMIAVGGGSVIDTAKAIAVGVPYNGDFWDFYAGKATAQAALPVGVVLTIPAAGSEGSGNAVITRTDGLIKLGIRYQKLLRPKFAIMNPELTFTLPKKQTAAGIADMMAHIMERYFSDTEGVEFTDRMCEGALKAIVASANAVNADPNNYDARANLMWAGTIAHNGFCGVGRNEDWGTHYMEHELSAMFDVVHGEGLAVLFPFWMQWAAEHNPHKVAQFAHRVFDIEETSSPKEDALKGADALRKFWNSLGLPATLREIEVPESSIDELAAKLHKNKGKIVGSYIPLDIETTKKIFRMAL